jgi:hypothetical protein
MQDLFVAWSTEVNVERLTCAILVLAGAVLIGAGTVAEAIILASGRSVTSPSPFSIGGGCVIAGVGLYGLFVLVVRGSSKNQ